MNRPVAPVQSYDSSDAVEAAQRGALSNAASFRKNLGLASLGAMLEYYDFVVYIYVASKIGAAFFPPGSSAGLRMVQTFAIYSIGFVIRPLAGMVIAHYADRFGRKRWFVATVVLMSVSTLMIGLLPTYAAIGWWAPFSLLVLRMLQGCAVGGELPSAAVFVAEHAGARRLGFSGAVLQSMAYGGFLLGALSAMVADLIASSTPDFPSLAWRLPFIVGGAFGLLSGYLRRALEETPLFVAMKRRGDAEPATPVRTVLRTHHRACLFGFGLILAMTVTNVVYFQYWPALLETQMHVPHGQALAVSLTAIVSIMIAMPVWGLAYDRFGWPRTMAVGALTLTILSGGLFSSLHLMLSESRVLFWAVIPVAAASGGVVAAAPGLLAAIFPTPVRQTGYALPYNLGVALFGGPLPLLLVWLTSSYGLVAPLYVLLPAYALVLVLAYAIRGIEMYLGRQATGAQPLERSETR
jgi:MFS family permease